MTTLTTTRTPERLIEAVLAGVGNPHTERSYRAGLERFLRWCNGSQPLNRQTVAAYVAELSAESSASTVRSALTAVKKLSAEAAVNGIIDPATDYAIQKVRGPKRLGVRSGHWLRVDEAQRLLDAPDRRWLGGCRDRALLALMLGCALRRSEAAAITVEHLTLTAGQPAIENLAGKGGRVRSFKIARPTYDRIKEWIDRAHITEGVILRPFDHRGRLTTRPMHPNSILAVVQKWCKTLGYHDIAPHDLRRTTAELARAGGARLEDIQRMLGHSSTETTQMYLDSAFNAEREGAADHLPLR